MLRSHTDDGVVDLVRRCCHQYPTATFSDIMDLCGHVNQGYIPVLIRFRLYLVAIREYAKIQYTLDPDVVKPISAMQLVYMASRNLVEKFTESTFWDACQKCPVYCVANNELAKRVFTIATSASSSIHATPELNKVFYMYIYQYNNQKSKSSK